MLTSGGSVFSAGGSAATQLGRFDTEEDVDVALPTTAAEAVSAGWKDPFLCSAGRGRYFQNEVEETPYFLMFDHEDNLTGVYLFSESEMPFP